MDKITELVGTPAKHSTVEVSASELPPACYYPYLRSAGIQVDEDGEHESDKKTRVNYPMMPSEKECAEQIVKNLRLMGIEHINYISNHERCHSPGPATDHERWYTCIVYHSSKK